MEKRILLIFSVIVALVLSACRSVNAYVDGSLWNGHVDEPSAQWTTYEFNFILEGDTVVGDNKYLKLWSVMHDVEKKELYYSGALLSIDDKVYYLPKGYETDFLIFDFDIKPGDKFKVYPGEFPYERKVPDLVSMVCVDKRKVVSCGKTYDVFEVAYENAKGQPILSDVGIWIKGIGTYQGPIENLYMGKGGNYYGINRVIVKEKEVFVFSEVSPPLFKYKGV